MNNQITPAIIKSLYPIQQLKEFKTPYNRSLTNEAVLKLSRFVNLTCLDIRGSGSQLNGDCFQVLSSLTNLRNLDIPYTRSKGLEYLHNLTKMERMDLSTPKIKDSELFYLSRMTKLHTLSLFYCEEVTELGIKMISHLTNLTSWKNNKKTFFFSFFFSPPFV